MEHRVFGPPGTGKTTYLTRQIRRAVESRGDDAVLVASFTKAAATELAGRDLPLPQSRVGTLHALCYRQLGMPVIAETKIRDFNREQKLYQLSADGGVDIDEPEQVFDTQSDRLFAQYQTYRARMLDRAIWPLDVLAFAKVWEGWKLAHNYCDFTDMIESCLREQLPPPGYPAIAFFDEVQDFTMLELSLIRAWSEYLDYIVLAGDDDQCIYGFKGATPQAFLTGDVAPENERVLDQSWRMPQAVHEYSQQWIHQIGESFRKEKQFRPRAEMGSVYKRPELRYRNATPVVEEACAVAEAGQTVMLLAACSYQVGYIVNELRNRGELFHNPYRRKRGDWNPLSSARRDTTISTRDRLLAFMQPSVQAMGEAAHPYTWSDLRLWTHMLKKTGAIRRGMSKLIEQGPEDAYVSAQDMAAIFEDAALIPIMRCNTTWLLEHVLADKQRPLEYPIKVAQRKGWACLFDEPKIVVGTIHSVKGGEANTVYLFPDVSPAGMVEYCDDRTRDGIYRQFYVGMTRAQENLVLCGASGPQAVRW